MAYLDERTYKEKLWDHEPLTDFWRIGRGYSTRLNKYGIYTMGDIALKSIEDEDFFYQLFGVNAELIIDHAWGYEPCTIKDIKNYKPTNKSVSIGQVLSEPYDYDKALIIVKEMADALALSLASKELCTDQITLSLGYDVSCLSDESINKYVTEDTKNDYLGREVVKPAHGTIHLKTLTSSDVIIMEAATKLYKRIINPKLLVRRVYIGAPSIKKEQIFDRGFEQLSLFDEEEKIDNKKILKDEKLQKTIIDIKDKFGKNAVVKGVDLKEGATTLSRNKQIGGHKA